MPAASPNAFTKRCEIRWRDMDAFKHVNNSVYLTYLEETRDEWFLAALGDRKLLDDFVLARCAIDFRSPLTQDDGEVEIAIYCTRIGTSSIAMAERVTSLRDGRLAAEAESVAVHYDPKTGKSVPLSAEIATAFEPWLR